MGCAAIAALAWQRATTRTRTGAPVGLALALGVAVSVHYYAALLVVPLAVAEGTRTVTVRRVNPSVWLALLAGMAPLAAWWPLIFGPRSWMMSELLGADKKLRLQRQGELYELSFSSSEH
jgi:hypothetical protein